MCVAITELHLRGINLKSQQNRLRMHPKEKLTQILAF